MKTAPKDASESKGPALRSGRDGEHVGCPLSSSSCFVFYGCYCVVFSYPHQEVGAIVSMWAVPSTRVPAFSVVIIDQVLLFDPYTPWPK